MSTYQASRRPVAIQKPRISKLRIVGIIFAIVSGLNVLSALSHECETPNSSNCTYHQDNGPDWTDFTFFGHYLRVYWPHFDEAVPEE